MKGLELYHGERIPLIGYGTGVVNHYTKNPCLWAKNKIRLVLYPRTVKIGGKFQHHAAGDTQNLRRFAIDSWGFTLASRAFWHIFIPVRISSVRDRKRLGLWEENI